MSSSTKQVVWAAPFRPFFLLTAAYAILTLIGWLAQLMGYFAPAGIIDPMRWHAHEMIHGMVAAVIAGFLLTAMATWTGHRLLSGPGLKALVALWLIGRLAMWSSAWLPPLAVSLLDLGFLLAVAIYAGKVIWQAGNHRNLIVVGVISALWLCNLAFHIGWLAVLPDLTRQAELAAIALIVMLLVIIGGRITPAFSRNWLRRHGGNDQAVRSLPWLEWTGLILLLLLVGLAAGGAPGMALGLVAGLAGIAHLARLLLWSGWLTRADPLMWILHVGYAWIPLGLLLMAWALLGPGLKDSAWLHALGVGAMSVMILGVMTRVALGHSGRPLALPAGAVWIYWLILASALLRLLTGLDWLPWASGLGLSTLAWIGAFTLFLVRYWSILIQPRFDGKPG